MFLIKRPFFSGRARQGRLYTMAKPKKKKSSVKKPAARKTRPARKISAKKSAQKKAVPASAKTAKRSLKSLKLKRGVDLSRNPLELMRNNHRERSIAPAPRR